MRSCILLFMLFYAQNTIYGEIKKATTFEEAASLILTADKNSWVIFNIDNVLITFENPLIPKHKNLFKQYVYDCSQDMHLVHLLSAPYRMKLIHSEWPSLIHSLQHNGVKTIATTKTSTGTFSYFKNLADLKYNALHKHHINFNHSFPNLEPRTFFNYNRFIHSHSPLFSNGIIYTCGLSKAFYLEKFIQYAKEKPKKIIFIDHDEHSIKKINTFCLKENIESLCIHYTYTEENNDIFFNEETAQLEFEQLQKDNIFFKNMMPPIAPQQESSLLNLTTIPPTDKTKNLPFDDHFEWTKEIYAIIKKNTNNNVNNKKKSLLHDLLYNTQNIEQEKQEMPPLPKFTEYEENFLEKFDQRDAKDILQPLLKKIFKFDLTLYEIGYLFLPYSQIAINMPQEKSNPDIFYQPENQEHIFNAAHKTYHLIKGNILFALGQAPSYLNVMIQEIAHSQNDNDTKIINIPFSGCPDYTQKIPDHYDPNLSYLNIVTHHKEFIFRKILHENYFTPKITDSKKIFIIDYSNGHSFESFINLLKRWFDDEKITHPEINIIHMGNPTSLNVTEIDTPHFLEINPKLLLSFTSIKDNLRIVPVFNALHWRDDYPKLFKKYPQLDAIPLIEQYKKFVRNKFISTQ